MRVKNSQGETTLLSEKSILRLTETGSVSPSDPEFIAASAGEGYFYKPFVTLPDASDPFLFCVQSDYDKIAISQQNLNIVNQGGETGISFWSTSSGPKNYRLYTTFNFSNEISPTNYGINLFDGSGNKVYDSRAPEAIFVDLLNIPSTNSASINHSTTNDCWYAISSFPMSFRITGQTNQLAQIFFRGVQQTSPSSTNVVDFYAGLIRSSGENGPNFYEGAMPIVTSLGLD